ncbi:MAG: hypothetical protein GW771_14265, partial [Flavobacteriia bacterium]|nr:hypothetical protein [Flavobacteriia bacterium]
MDCTIFKYLLYSIKKQKHYRHNLQPSERTLKIDPVGQFKEAASLPRWQPTKIIFNGDANQYISYLYNATGVKIQDGALKNSPVGCFSE